ncbi:MAG: peptidoglycan DD-metalloendopeptidase family protein [Acidimicrobiales bacterium]
MPAAFPAVPSSAPARTTPARSHRRVRLVGPFPTWSVATRSGGASDPAPPGDRRGPRARRRPLVPGVALALVGTILFGCLLVGAAPPAAAVPATSSVAGPPAYRPPVAGVVVDPFRAPPGPYAAGNRGLEYAVVPGTPVVAAGDGEVIFAGAVGGSLHVTVRHPDGLRTSYSFLAAVSVGRGRHVTRGQQLGVAGALLHFGVRDPAGTYLDPARLLSGDLAPDVHLVPLDAADDPAVERRALGGVVAAAGRLAGAVSTASSSPADLGRGALGGWRSAWAQHVVAGLPAALAPEPACTPPARTPPPLPPGRRILVLVGGLGSTSATAAVDRIDTAALGYAPEDVVRFSYRGGRIPTSRSVSPGLASVEVRPYDAADTQGDLEASGHALRALLDDIARAEPGVPVDVVAHSQGGVVARLALGDGVGAPGDPPAPAATLVTLGSPHDGADLATSLAAVRQVPGGAAAVEAVRSLVTPELDPARPSIEQLARDSDLQTRLRPRPVPPGVRVVSIGARGDLVVPAPRTELAGAGHTTVPRVGLHAHDRLPGSPEVARELALALAGAPPSCRAIGARLADLVVGEGIAAAEEATASALPG